MQILEFGINLDPAPSLGKKVGKTISTGRKVEEKSSNDVAETSGEETKTRQECAFCASCTEEYPLSDTIRTECAHNYCRECILRLFENSLTHEALFPPRCCRLPIRVSTAVEDMLGIEMIKRYQERKVEVNDLRRTYCSNPTCSHYIPPQNIRHGVGICGVCTVRTCTDCKKQAHRGGDCSKHRHAFDEKINDNLLEELAKKKKWKRCSKCSRIIELIDGCFSIHCRCGANFCYKCGKTQSICRCSNNPHAYLYRRNE